jgi:hypothetical protein
MTRLADGLKPVALLLCCSLGLGACSAYNVHREPAWSLSTAPPAIPVTVAVWMAELASPEARKAEPFARTLVQDIYRNFVRTLDQAAVFGRVIEAPASTPSAPVLAEIKARLDRSGAGDKFLKDFLVGLTLYTMSPFLKANETFTIDLELSVTSTTPPRWRQYIASGTATLVSQINAPREQAVREAVLAAAQSASEKVIEQLARDLELRRALGGSTR